MSEKVEIKFEFTQEDIERIVAPIKSAPTGGYSSIQKNKEIYTKAFTLFAMALDERLQGTISALSERVEGAEEVNRQAIDDAEAAYRNADSSAVLASNSATYAEECENNAVAAASVASSASSAAQNAKVAAEAAQSVSERLKTETEEYKALAGYYRQQTEKASDEAETARNEAVAAKDVALQAQEDALIYKQDAEAAKATAEEAANYVSTSIRDVAKAKSFDNYSALVNHLQNDTITVPYATGQPFFIIELDVPDLYVSAVDEATKHFYTYISTDKFLTDLDDGGGKLWVGNYQLAKLETAKVYLGDLQKKEDSSLQTSSKNIPGAINEVNAAVKSIENAKGKANGYASLGADGKVLENQLPDLNYQRPTDELLNTESKEIVGAINELDGRLDGIGDTIKEEVKETADGLERVEGAIEQAKITQAVLLEEAYSSRVTAGGRNVLNGSTATLHEFVGNTAKCTNLFDGTLYSGYWSNTELNPDKISDRNSTIQKSIKLHLIAGKYYLHCDKTLAVGKLVTNGAISNPNSVIEQGSSYSFETRGGEVGLSFYLYNGGAQNWEDDTLIWVNKEENTPYEPYFAGLKHTSFAGVKSTSIYGEESELRLSKKIELGKWDSIDVQTSEITKATRTIVFTGDEEWLAYPYHLDGKSVYHAGIIGKMAGSTNLISNLYQLKENAYESGIEGDYCGSNGNNRVYFVSYFSTVDEWKAHLAELYAAGTPLTVAYEYYVPTVETIDNVTSEYKVWANGTETVLENDGAEFDINPTLTQSYTVVNKITEGGGSSNGSAGSGGLSESEVQSIANIVATSKANSALSSAKTYTDEKTVKTVNASVDSSNILTVEIKAADGTVLATTTVTLPSGGGDFNANALVDEFNNPSITLTDADKTNACNYLGAIKKLGAGGRNGIQAYGITQAGDSYMINAQYGEPIANDSGNGFLTVQFYRNIIKPALDKIAEL